MMDATDGFGLAAVFQMNRFTLLPLLLVLLLWPSAHAQRRGKIISKPTPSTPSRDAQKPSPSRVSPTVEYDRFKDETEVGLQLHLVSRQDSSLTLYIVDSAKGRTYVSSGYIAFALLSDRDTWISDIYNNLYLLLDEDRIELHMKFVSSGSRMAVISEGTFLQIAEAKKLEGKFGTTEFTLNDRDLASLKELAKIVSPTRIQQSPKP